MAKSRTLGVSSFARFQAVLVAQLGLTAGILYSFGGVIYDLLTTGSVNWGTALAFFALIGMPATFAAFGFVVGAIEALLHNLLARWSGGLEIDFVR